jgi:hypothetical protein
LVHRALPGKADRGARHGNFTILEDVNKRIKAIKRMAYGFRDSACFFLKIKAAFPCKVRPYLNLETSVAAYPSLACHFNTGPCASELTHLWRDCATWQLARLAGRPALSHILAGMSLLRRRFAPAIPPRRTISYIQLRLKG